MGILKESKIQLRRALSYLHRDRPALLTFLFHALFEDNQELDKHAVDPQQRITVAHMREFITYFLDAGYQFVSPEQARQNPGMSNKLAMITFDDGYFNNIRILPLLEEFNIPAVFFITTGNIQRNECFWWDVVYRERHRQGWSKPQISSEQKQLKRLHHRDIIAHLKSEFGESCLSPWGDTDRPMTPDELAGFAKHPNVFIGNHTSEHYLLDNYPDDEVLTQIQDGQAGLRELIQLEPDTIAYPNGSYSESAIRAARKLGMTIGITVDKRKNPLPIDWDSNDALALGRFVLWGDRSISQQCDIFRSDVRLI
ncbi:MAG: polysaccharide deacetylase family protein [bacterium]